MLGRRCSLCNGKLNNKKICTECGLDNSKSEKYYKVNRSSCDELPMTHIHEEVRKDKKQKYSYQSARPVKKQKGQKKDAEGKKKNSVISVITTLSIVIPAILGFVGNLTDSYEDEPDYSTEAIFDPYEYLEEEHPADGDTIAYSLESGQYVVGVHIAPGNYYAEVYDDLDTVEIADRENSIYLYANKLNEEGAYLQDLRLFEGAIVTICTKGEILLQTDNGQTGEIPAMVENFVKESYVLQRDSDATAGDEFEPGIYDLCMDKNYAYVSLTIYNEDGSERDFRGYNMGTDGIHGICFRNVVIPEGAIITCENSAIELIPSEWIWTTDYLEYYQ